MTSGDIKQALFNCNDLKPNDLIIDDLQWKYLYWAVLKGKNILFVGPTRSGKTKAAKSVAECFAATETRTMTDDELDELRKNPYVQVKSVEESQVTYTTYNRPIFIFNCGSSQDARALFIGNTHFSKEKGTWFSQSEFIKSIQIPHAIILLDELSRLSHDGMNIIMPAIDGTQKCIRLDETEDSKVIPIAEGVSFIATANIGNEYTATRVMDKALLGRFPVIVEMKVLTAEQEEKLLNIRYPEATDAEKKLFKLLTKISDDTKSTARMDNPRITNFITTDAVMEMGGLILDGFSLNEIAEMTIYPLYSEDGGADCERLVVKQMVQKYIDIDSANTKSPINDPNKKKKLQEIDFS